MGTSAARTTKKSHSASVSTAGSFFRAPAGPGFFAPVHRKAAGTPFVQPKLKVSKPDEPLEKAADRTADTVMRMSDDQVPRAAAAPAATASGATASGAPLEVQRLAPGAPPAAPDVGEQIRRSATGGQALPGDIRTFMEPRLGVDLGGVRVHADENAALLSNRLSARAFTYGQHIFFARDQYRPGTDEGRRLLAHELAHTMQQGASAGVPGVQRWGVQDVLDYFADKAYHIPGFRMLTLVLGFNPINLRRTERTAANFLRALIELVPGGSVITRVLDNHGVIDKAAAWVQQKIATLGDIGAQIVDGLKRFIDSLGWRDIFRLGSVWDRAKRIFTDPIGRLISFGKSVVVELLTMVKDAILRPLAALAARTRGYDLLKAILGRDPLTGDPYPRTADTLIGGFMKLIGQQEVWENLKRGKAVARAWAWFQQTLSGLLAFALSIPTTLLRTLASLTFTDIITVVGAFSKVGSALLGIAGRFGSWAFGQVLGLLEILLSVVAPRAVPYLAKSRAAFHRIIKDPVGFVRNLVRAGKLGFQMFAGNFLKHLKDALIKWLIGPLGEAGVYIPKSFDLLEIVKLVLSVLGLTWANIRTKLLKIIPEPVLQALEKTASVLVTLATKGPAAAWEQIKAELAELKTQLLGQVTRMIQIEVVKAAVKKLAMMLNPAGAVIQAILAIWNTVSFFISRISQIGAVVASFIDSIAAIASGQVAAAAKRVEQTLARTLVVVVGFLAKFAGLGNIPTKLVGIVKKVRAPIDKGLDKIVGWLGGVLNKLKSVLGGDFRTAAEKERDVQLAKRDAQALLAEEGATSAQVQSRFPSIRTKYKLTAIALHSLGGNRFDVSVAINPTAKTAPQVLKGSVEIPPGLVVGIHVKFTGQIWKVQSLDDTYLVLAHATNVRDTRKFSTAIFVTKFKEGMYPAPTAEELKAIQDIDPNFENKIIGKPQDTQTPGHAALMLETAHRFAKMLTVKMVYLDRAYRLIRHIFAGQPGELRRADVVVEHTTGRIDVIEIQSRSDREDDLRARNVEALLSLPPEQRGNVDVIRIPGIKYRDRS